MELRRRQHQRLSGDNLADLLLGHLSSWNQGNALSDYIRQNVFAFYFQDTWRATEHPDRQSRRTLGAAPTGLR